MTKFLSVKNDMHMQLAFTAMATFPTLQEATDYLWAEHQIKTTPEILESYTRPFPRALAEAKAKVAPLKEAKLRYDLQDTAAMGIIATQAAIEQTQRLLEEGKIQDPAKAGRDMMQVVTQSVDKRALLEGKPTQIVEKRSTEEILRQLEAKGVVRRELDVPEAEVVDEPG